MLERAPGRRADRHRLGLLRPRQLLQIVEHAHRLGREGADRAEDDRAARPARRVRPRPGRAAVRAAAAGLRRRRLGGEADVRPRRRRPRRRRRAAALAGDRGGDQARPRAARCSTATRASASASSSSGCSSSGRWSPAPPDQQDELERENEAEGALFKIRDDPRVTQRRAAPAALLDRRAAERAQRPARRDEPRRPAPAAAPRLRAARGLAPQARRRAARDDRPLADLRPLRPVVRRPRAARLLLPRELVDRARHLDPAKTLPAVLASRGAY